ncbi:MAG: type II toxin-antitoxin system VapC family toxin [Patescibacteria group bacterium]
MKKIFLDSNIFIYFFEGNKKYKAKLEKLFHNALEKKIKLTCSVIVWSEILHLPFKKSREDLLAKYSNLDNKPFAIDFIPVNRKIAIDAARIRAFYSVKTPDAIHLATALSENIDEFWTNDKRLNKFKELKITTLS